MRPVTRGAPPRGGFTSYNDARPALEDRLGDYCSYCEMPNATDVEHKLPKAAHPARELSWDNFLLSCKSCNGIKHHEQDPGSASDPDAALSRYLWPDTDNTARAFVYHQHNNDVTVAPGLRPDVAGAAAATIRMTGIDRIPGKTPGPTHKDKRWKKRAETWRIAEIERGDLARSDTLEQRECIARLAKAQGFWSVWRVVFARDPDMLRRIDQAFTGTTPDCFDPTTRKLIARPSGRL